ncbi:MAG TPA: hypothetical protein VGX16_07260, partial [Solirubrobacteraceae bacterium]|nr:hypothetical protein [Solirubrobacteraceae bacterium]
MRTVARLAALLSVAALLLGALADAPAAPAASPAYAPREIVVRYFEKNAPRARARTRAASIFGESPTARAARVIAAA